MSGRIKVGYAGQYAISEVDFWLNDPRIQAVGSSVKVFYHYAWMIAVKERREVLPTHWTPLAIGKAARLDTKTTPKAYRTLLENSLLGQTPDGRIIVCGIKGKHRNLRWKDDSISGEMTPQMEVEAEMEVEPSKRLAALPPDDSESVSGESNGRYGRELRAVARLWDKRFPTHRLCLAEYGKIRTECHRHGVSPVVLVNLIPEDHLAPWKYACGYFADKYPWPEPEGSDKQTQTFDGWQMVVDRNGARD